MMICMQLFITAVCFCSAGLTEDTCRRQQKLFRRWLEVLQEVTDTTGTNEELSPLFCFFILYNDQQMHNYFTNYNTPTCFDTIVSSSDSLPSYRSISNAAVGNTIYN